MKSLSKNLKSKIAVAAALVLVVAMVVSFFAVTTVSAQDPGLIMNLPGADGPTIIHEVMVNEVGYDIDLNGPTEVTENVALLVKYPRRADFTVVGVWTTGDTPGSFADYDLDIYTGEDYCPGIGGPFMFNETGMYELKWAIHPDYVYQSNTERVWAAMPGWNVYIEATLSSGRVRGEIRYDNDRQSITNTNMTLAAKAPGDTDWTYYGPFSTTNGRYDYTYDFTELGVHTLQYIVEPMNELPTNPDTPDGCWYSPIVDVESAASIYISVNPETEVVRGEVRINDVRVQVPFENMTLAYKAPGDTAWTELLFNTTNGRVDYTYDFDEDWGVHQFQWIVPPQGPLPVNPDTTDGQYYSPIVEINYEWSIYISTP